MSDAGRDSFGQPPILFSSSRRLTRRRFLSLAAAGLGLAAGCAPTPTPDPTRPLSSTPIPASTVPQNPVKIGVLVARTGLAASLGQAGQRASEWWSERANKSGGILGRRVQLLFEEESTPEETARRYQKLALQDSVDLVVGVVTTEVARAVGQVADRVGVPLLHWDATFRSEAGDASPTPKWVFGSTDDEVDVLGAALLIPKYFPLAATVAGINSDDSRGRASWAAFMKATDRLHALGLLPARLRPVLSLFTKPGETDFSAQVSEVARAKPDLLLSTLRHMDGPLLIKQAWEAGLLLSTWGVFPSAGGMGEDLKKRFVPEGLLVGYKSMYFDDPLLSPLAREYLQDYRDKYNEYPSYMSDHAVFVLEAYRAAVEAAYQALGRWPEKEQVATALEGIEVDSLSGRRSYRRDHAMTATWHYGLTTRDNKYDLVTIDPIERLPLLRIQRPEGSTLSEWIGRWQIDADGLPNP